MSLLSFGGCESPGCCESSAVPDTSGCDGSTNPAAGSSTVEGCGAASSGGVSTRFVGAVAVPEPAADAAAVFQVSEAVVSARDCARAKVLANTTSSIATSDAPAARCRRALLTNAPAFFMLHHAALA